MTAVGKILVFLTMAMSLALGAISLFVHALVVKKNNELVETRKVYEANQSNITLYTKDKSTWSEERSKLERSRSDLESRLKDFDTLFKQAALEGQDPAKLNEYLSLQRKVNQDLSVKLKGVEQQLALLQTDGKAKLDEANDANQSKTLSEKDATTRASQIGRIQDELRIAVKDRQSMFMDKNRMFEEKTQAEIVSTALRTRNSEMEKELKRLSVENKRLRDQGGVTSAKPVAGGTRDNPPAAELQGKVVKADSAGLMQVNLGSDDGLQRGHTLELFRLDPPAYLGRVKVIEVNPKDAVAQPLDRLNGKPTPGDSVSSRIR